MGQVPGAVQEIFGSLEPGQVDVFIVQGLTRGQSQDLYMENTSGNLDPLLAILPTGIDLASTLEKYSKEIAETAANSPNPIKDLPALRDRYALAWDDDSGKGYSAALSFNVPKSGDYYLIASSSLSAAGRATFGTYRLLVGLDAPQVLDGTAQSTGAVIVVQSQAVLGTQLIQEITGSLGVSGSTQSFTLNDINAGDTLYVNLQATSGNLRPILFLRDYSKKPVRVANLSAQ